MDARFALTAISALIILAAALASPLNAWAASGLLTCRPGISCVVGEFLYDDSYVPITDASCKITSRYPDGTLFRDAVVMTSSPESDGYYSHSFTTPSTPTGAYRTQVSCKTISATFATTDVNTSTEQIVVGRNISLKTTIKFSSTGTLPAGLTAGTKYYAINVNSTTIKVATSSYNAEEGVAIDLTSQGSGTHTIESDDNMSLDKTFEVKVESTLDQTSVAGAVWNASRGSYVAGGSFGQALQNIVPSTADIWAYSSRTLSNFGTLVDDTWGYSNRSLTTFGSLAVDVWNSATRTLTGAGLTSGSLATLSDVNSARDNIKGASNKDLSQVYSNVESIGIGVTALITDTTTLKSDTTTLKSDTTTIKTTVNSIYTDTQALRTDVTSILNKWGTSSAADIKSDIAAVSSKLGVSTDSDTTASVFGRIEFVRNKWGSQTAQTIYDKALAASNTATAIQAELDFNGKTTTAYQDLQTLKTNVVAMQTLIGGTADASTIATLFGRIKKVQEKVDTLSAFEADLAGILDTWGQANNLHLVYGKVVEVKTGLSSINASVDLSSVLTEIGKINPSSTTIVNNTTQVTQLKNEIITLQALVGASRDLLETTTNKPYIKTFLLEGSVIFKSLIVNPSNKISQTVDFVYYLPTEVKKEDILELDESLTLDFDSEKNQYAVKGEYRLAPAETKTVSIRTEDIWLISDPEVSSVRKQAEELSKVLSVNTAFFAQGVTLKSDIDVSLDKVVEIQKSKITPDAKIRAYREAKIEFDAAKVKTEKLKELVTQASSAGNFLGFVGGSQAIAVWGLIIIMAAGFFFLAMYMRMLQTHGVGGAGIESVPPADHRSKTLPKTVAAMVITAMISTALTGAVVYKVTQVSNNSMQKIAEVKPDKAGSQVLGERKEVTQEDSVLTSKECNLNSLDLSQGSEVLLLIEGDQPATVYCQPNDKSSQLSSLDVTQVVSKLGEIGEWVLISYDLSGSNSKNHYGWIKQQKLVNMEVEKSKEVSLNKELILQNKPAAASMIMVASTPTGYLNVRSTPGGAQIAQIKPGESYQMLGEDKGWVQISLQDNSLGWVAKQYTTK